VSTYTECLAVLDKRDTDQQGRKIFKITQKKNYDYDVYEEE
jgi:hypothetical protein